MNDETSNTTQQQADVEVVKEKLADAQVPGFKAEFDALEAERAGAFYEDALSELEAAASLGDPQDDLVPGFISEADDDVNAPLPAFISTTNSLELYDPQPGETVAEAITRKASGG